MRPKDYVRKPKRKASQTPAPEQHHMMLHQSSPVSDASSATPSPTARWQPARHRQARAPSVSAESIYGRPLTDEQSLDLERWALETCDRSYPPVSISSASSSYSSTSSSSAPLEEGFYGGGSSSTMDMSVADYPLPKRARFSSRAPEGDGDGMDEDMMSHDAPSEHEYGAASSSASSATINANARSLLPPASLPENAMDEDMEMDMAGYRGRSVTPGLEPRAAGESVHSSQSSASASSAPSSSSSAHSSASGATSSSSSSASTVRGDNHESEEAPATPARYGRRGFTRAGAVSVTSSAAGSAASSTSSSASTVTAGASEHGDEEQHGPNLRSRVQRNYESNRNDHDSEANGGSSAVSSASSTTSSSSTDFRAAHPRQAASNLQFFTPTASSRAPKPMKSLLPPRARSTSRGPDFETLSDAGVSSLCSSASSTSSGGSSVFSSFDSDRRRYGAGSGGASVSSRWSSNGEMATPTPEDIRLDRQLSAAAEALSVDMIDGKGPSSGTSSYHLRALRGSRYRDRDATPMAM